MLNIDYVKEHYADFETYIDDRFGARFVDFLPYEEWKDYGFSIREGCEPPTEPKEWTEETYLRSSRRTWSSVGRRRATSAESRLR